MSLSQPSAVSFEGRERHQPLVLVVDDDDDHRAYCRYRFERMGWRVIDAAERDVALREAAQAQPDLVLMDLCMPLASGFDLARALRDDLRTRDLRIVAMTNLGSAWQKHARLAGFDLVLSKAFIIDRFEDVARRLLRKSAGDEATLA